jgi:hypothetical protein
MSCLRAAMILVAALSFAWLIAGAAAAQPGAAGGGYSGQEPGATGARLILETGSPTRLAHFYRDELRLPVLAEDRVSGRTVLDAGGTQLVIVRGGAGSGPGAVRLLLPSADLEASARFLDGLKRSYRELRTADGSLAALFFRDPEGNPVGYVQRTLPVRAWLAPLETPGAVRENDRSGRVGLMVYGGTYGTWLGVAIPVGSGSDDPTVIGLSVIAGGPLGVLVADRFAHGRDVGKGRTGTLTLAGNFGTWQGIGWSVVADADAEEVLLVGAATGLGSLVAAGALTERVSVSEGQSLVLHGAANWGAWYGLAGAELADPSGDDVVLATLLGSSVGLGIGTIWALNNDMSPTRATLLNLGGILGTALGFGLDLVFRVEDTEGVFAVAGLGTTAGLVGAVLWTRDRFEQDRSEGFRLSTPARLALGRDGTPRLELVRASF